MLVLTRNIGESFIIGGNIIVKVLAVSHRQVRIGIAAPAEIEIWRAELLAKLKAQKEAKAAHAAEKSGEGE